MGWWSDGVLVAVRVRRGTSWTTDDEVGFLAHLGTYTIRGEKVPRRFWLERYREAMALRTAWGAIDRDAVSVALTQSLGGADALPHGNNGDSTSLLDESLPNDQVSAGSSDETVQP